MTDVPTEQWMRWLNTRVALSDGAVACLGWYRRLRICEVVPHKEEFRWVQESKIVVEDGMELFQWGPLEGAWTLTGSTTANKWAVLA